MVRRIGLLFVALVIVACGGEGGAFDDPNPQTFPVSKTLTLRYVNSSATPANMFQGDDLPTPDNLVAPGASRTETVDAVWVSADDRITFEFHALPDGGTVRNVSIEINGTQSQASNFGGFDVGWNGSELSASTGGTDEFPVTKRLTLRLENNSADDSHIFVNPETAGDSNIVAPAGLRILNQTKSWNASTETQDLVFTAATPGHEPVTATLSITGEQALDPSLSGYAVRWDGTDLVVKRLEDSPYPYTKGLRAVLKNNGTTPINLYMDDEVIGVDNLVGPGEVRLVDVKATWIADEDERTFTFRAGSEGQELFSVPIQVAGAGAQANNFSGFDAVWDGASLAATTH